MKLWLENHVKKTEISAWIYAPILLALIMALVPSVGGKVLKTSLANPAKAAKVNLYDRIILHCQISFVILRRKFFKQIQYFEYEINIG